MDDFASNSAECPFQLNFDAETFAIGGTVSYRVAGSLEGFPFMGTLLELHEDHVLGLRLNHNQNPSAVTSATPDRKLAASLS